MALETIDTRPAMPHVGSWRDSVAVEYAIIRSRLQLLGEGAEDVEEYL